MILHDIITANFRALASDVHTVQKLGAPVTLQCVQTTPAGSDKCTLLCYIPLSGDEARDQDRVESFISLLVDSTEQSRARATFPAGKRG